MNLTLYGKPISPFVTRVVIQMSAKGLNFPVLEPPGGTESPEYHAINPLGKIPTLVVDGTKLPESQVICDFLEDSFPEPSLRPRDPVQRARAHLYGRLAEIYVMNAMLPLFRNMNPKTRNQAVFDWALAETVKGLEQLESFTTGEAYAVGNSLTLADCSAAPILFFCERFLPMFGASAPFAKTPRVKDYWTGIQRNPHVAKGVGGIANALAKA